VRPAIAPLLIALLYLPQDDPVATLKNLAARKGDAVQARKILAAGLQDELRRAAAALAEAKLDAMESHLIRAATLARPYSTEYAQTLIAVLLSVRMQVRSEGMELVRACADDVRAGRNPQERLAAAQKDSILSVTFKDPLSAFAAKMKDWQAKAPEPAAVEAEVAKWRAIAPARTSTGCTPCKSAGEVDCASCETGAAVQECPYCAAKGSIECPLCKGKATIAHSGYVGPIRLTLTKAISVKVVLSNGKNAQARLHPQVLTWTLGACDGKGAFPLHTESKPLDSTVKEAAPVDAQQKCERLWQEMKNFVFTGRATIEVPGENGAWVAMKPEAAKRLFADYEKCKDGQIPCDACAGKKTSLCTACNGRGSRLGACSGCAGSAMKPCDACGFVGDTAWLAALLPEVKGLKEELACHAAVLRSWLEERGKQAARAAYLRDQLAATRRQLDPKAVLSPGFVSVPCEVCKGAGGTCDSCWGVGRREYFEGTPQFQKYAAADRLARQLTDLAKLMRRPAPIEPLTLPEEIAAAKEPPKRDPPKEPPKETAKFSGIGGTIGRLPDDLQQQLKKGDALHEEGKEHLAKAKETKDNDVWAAQSKKALACLREAQQLYAGAQEACDERGLPVPRELLDKVGTNLQALVMARKQSP